MSHYSQIALTVTDQGALVAALKELGYGTVEVHTEPQVLYDWCGRVSDKSAHVIVRRQHLSSVSNDLGFLRGADGRFAVAISDYDRSGSHITAADQEAWVRKVTQLAGVHSAIRVARQRGHRVERKIDDRGRIQLVIRGRF